LFTPSLALNHVFSAIAAGDKSSTRKLKHDVIAAIGDLIDEIDSCYEPISEQAVELIHQKYDCALAKYYFLI